MHYAEVEKRTIEEFSLQKTCTVPFDLILIPRGRRPLRMQQIYYAALDAFAGLELYERLHQLTEEKGVSSDRFGLTSSILDAIASPSTYPCQSVSGSAIVSDCR